MTDMVNRFKEGQEICYDGHVGVIRFISEEYLTMCLKRKCDGMISDICLVVYSYLWDEVEPV